MKKLALLILAILILGCGTENTVVDESVVEEPEPVIEEPTPIVEEPKPVIGEPLLAVAAPALSPGPIPQEPEPPKIEVDVDPELHNADGFRYECLADLKLYIADLRRRGGESLHWLPQGVVRDKDINIGNVVVIKPGPNSQLLEFDTEYVISIFTQDLDCNIKHYIRRFRTKPEFPQEGVGHENIGDGWQIKPEAEG